MFWSWFTIGAGLMLGISVALIPVLLFLSTWGIRMQERNKAVRLANLVSGGSVARRTKDLLEELRKMKAELEELKRRNPPSVGH